MGDMADYARGHEAADYGRRDDIEPHDDGEELLRRVIEEPPVVNFKITPFTDGGEGAFYKAMAAAQKDFRPLVKNKTVTVKPREKPSYTFSYADLGEVDAATSPALNDHGFALFEPAYSVNSEELELRLLIGHEVGKLEAIIRFTRPNDLQAFGSALTYLRRYMRTSTLGVVAEHDDDGNGASGNSVESYQDRQPANRPPAEQRQQQRQAPAGAAPNQRGSQGQQQRPAAQQSAPARQEQPATQPEPKRQSAPPAAGPGAPLTDVTMQAIVTLLGSLQISGPKMVTSCREATKSESAQNGVTPTDLKVHLEGEALGQKWLASLKKQAAALATVTEAARG